MEHHRIDPYPIPNDTKLIYIMNHNRDELIEAWKNLHGL